jgi:RES domain-containing protein
VTVFQGWVWRILPRDADPALPVVSPEGRFHHSGQSALYASLTPGGSVVAIRRYLAPDDPPRVIVPLRIEIANLADLRDQAAASVIWQDIRAGGAPSPTWAISDAARNAGAEAMVYSSRSRPELSHLVLFVPPSRLIREIGTPLDAAPYLVG